MSSELLDIIDIAERAIARYGRGAAEIMEARARSLESFGEREGATMSHQVAMAIREIERGRRHPGRSK
jgi:hypothetical protein